MDNIAVKINQKNTLRKNTIQKNTVWYLFIFFFICRNHVYTRSVISNSLADTQTNNNKFPPHYFLSLTDVCCSFQQSKTVPSEFPLINFAYLINLFVFLVLSANMSINYIAFLFFRNGPNIWAR